MNCNNNKKEFNALPISPDEYQMVKHKQTELITKRGKMVSLTEIANELVQKGLDLLE